MTITWQTELFDSKSATHGLLRGKGIRIYRIGHDEDYGTAKTYCDTNVPLTLNGVGTPEFEEYDLEHEGNGIWLWTIRYSTAPSSEPGEIVDAFQTGGATARITQAKQHIARFPGTAPNCNGAINVTKDSVEGTEIIVPTFKFQRTMFFDPVDVDAAYRLAVFGLTGKVNDATFLGFSAGEVLFEGASGTIRGSGNWEIQFSFAVSPNVTGLSMGPISGISKGGWEYLWTLFEDFEDVNLLVKKAVGVYVERVYDAGDFSLLGIGT